MLKQKGQEWGFWECEIVLNGLTKDCSFSECDLIREEFSHANTVSVGLLSLLPKGSVFLFFAGGYGYFVFEESDKMRSLFIVA